MKLLPIVFSVLVAVCCLSAHVVSQSMTGSSGALLQGEVTSIVTVGDVAFVEFAGGAVMVVPTRIGDQIAAEAGLPPASVHIEWSSAGTNVKLDFHQQENESPDKFADRVGSMLAKMLKTLPPDPPKKD